MMIPTVHLNGTAKENLLSELHAAFIAVQAAIDQLRQVTVHGRDYYPQGVHAFPQARAEMDARLRSLEKTRDDLMVMHAGIRDQGRGPG